jgi:hypothetical protein
VAQFVGVVLSVKFPGLVPMALRMEVMGVGDVRVVRSLLVVASRVRLRRGMVVSCGMLVVACGVPVMLDLFFV